MGNYHQWNLTDEEQKNKERAICDDCKRKKYKKFMIVKTRYYSSRGRDNNVYICNPKLTYCVGRRMS